ncbi:DUF2637 domain-containing protein [Streptomyces sp. 4F14]|uniref:DUF2637 domain-containing protein n=1 Tax=Streptomyces sp. 4F14 TaxID=3394380 RepID=UPI003A88D355
MRRPVARTVGEVEVWVRRVGAAVVAGVAAYASHVHQREFALQGGADEVSANLWPLSVDGLLLSATAGMLKQSADGPRRARYVVRAAFLLGIGVSLAANVAAAPDLAWKPVLVAGWPPVALLLAVELLGPWGRVLLPEAWRELIRCWRRRGKWMRGIGSCISGRSLPSRCGRNYVWERGGRGSWWLWCGRVITARLRTEYLLRSGVVCGCSLNEQDVQIRSLDAQDLRATTKET